MREGMGRLLQSAHAIWVVALAVLGLWTGVTVGYENGAWIGAVCLGATGGLIGGLLGLGGARLLLQLLS